MELKTSLKKPYSEEQRINFIVEQNHNKGFEIRETETALEAWGKDAEEIVEDKKLQVRAIRSYYFDEYVDWYQSKPLLWNELSEDEKQSRGSYRQYLKDYTQEEEWWEHNPLDYNEWLEKEK